MADVATVASLGSPDVNKARLRALWRASRDVPVVGAIVRALDRPRWVRAISGSGLVDSAFYAAQLGRAEIGERVAIWHYVTTGFRRGMSLNPLFDEIFAGGNLPEVFRVPALYAYVVSDRVSVAVHPLWNAVRESEERGTPALEDLWSRRAAATLTVRAGAHCRELSVALLRESAIEDARRWAGGDLFPAAASDAGDDAHAVILRIIQRGDRRYARRLLQLAERADGIDRAAILIDPDASQWCTAALLQRVVPGIDLLGFDRRATWADAAAGGAERSSAEVAIVLDPRIELDDAHIDSLLAVASEGNAVVPASRSFDGTLAGIGAARVGGARPWRILGAHPAEDLDALGEELISVPLLTGRTVALARHHLLALRDIHPPAGQELEALCLRLQQTAHETTFFVDPRIRPVHEEPETAFVRRRNTGIAVPVNSTLDPADEATARDLVERAGFDFHGWLLDGVEPRPDLSWRRPSREVMRWAIKICAPAGTRGKVWGDTHFATGLARALRRGGHFVVIDAYDARDRATTYLDDVSIVIRGPYRVDPPGTGRSIQWVISHPDKVTKREAAAFDAVFAASATWALKKSRLWGVAVESLLECTDTDQFFPRGLPRTDEIVFVGTARGIARPSVVAPLAAGIPVRVYGPDWRALIPASAVVATSIPNSELSARYETASVVLNDQWPAMQREGFIAMRPFDVVAAGGRVISEYVEGIEDVFGEAVPVFHDTDELLRMLRQDPDDLFPDAGVLHAASERVRRDHSFDARAAYLIAAARRIRTDLGRH